MEQKDKKEKEQAYRLRDYLLLTSFTERQKKESGEKKK